MDKEIANVIKAFLDSVKDFSKAYKNAFEEVGKCDKATQDLLHQLELGEYNERGKTTTQLVQVRKNRRLNKDLTLILEPLVNLLKEETSRQFIRKLEQVLGDTRKIENNLITRQYYPRVIRQLKFCITKDGENANGK